MAARIPKPPYSRAVRTSISVLVLAAYSLTLSIPSAASKHSQAPLDFGEAWAASHFSQTDKPVLTLARSDNAVVIAGVPTRFEGRTRKKLAGLRVALQLKTSGGQWRTVKRARISRSGRFQLQGTSSTAGTVFWRASVVRQSRSKPRQATSNVVRTTSYVWYRLADSLPVEKSFWWSKYSFLSKIGGELYPDSVGAELRSPGESSYGVYNLGYACREFAFSMGLDDDESNSGSSVRFFLQLDDTERQIGTAQLGAAQAQSVSTVGILRVRLRVQLDKGEALAVFGSPRVLCSRRP